MLETDNESSYLNSEWANPKAFKNNAQGLGGGASVKFRVPFG
jgi:hypothetical protein